MDNQIAASESDPAPGNCWESMEDVERVHTDEKLHAVFRRYLKTHGIKYTGARQKVLDAAVALSHHFETEEVLYLLQERGIKVSKATVYRTIVMPNVSSRP